MSPEDREQLAAERRALKSYLARAHGEPLVLDRRAAYCVDAVLMPSWFARLRHACRYLVVALAGLAPFCPMKVFLYRLVGMRIGRTVCISPGVVMDPLYPALIELEDGACLGMGCRLLTHEYTAGFFRVGRIRIGRRAVVGCYAMVRGGVAVGSGATVGAMSFVNRDVAAGETVAGIPARPVSSAAGTSAPEGG